METGESPWRTSPPAEHDVPPHARSDWGAAQSPWSNASATAVRSRWPCPTLDTVRGCWSGAPGLILTAKHVVEGARLLAVQLQGAARAVPARLVYLDPTHDLAWLAIADASEDFVELEEPPEPLAVRSKVFVIGYPLDATRTDPQSQSGVISGERPDGSLQLAVALNAGNSGGPVIDESGQLLGIAVAGGDPRRGAQGIGVAVPLEQIRQSFAKVRDGQLLEKTSAELSAHRAHDLERATILGALMTSDGVVESLRLREDADEQAGAAFWNALKSAVRTLGAESPELLLLAASRHFNNAVGRRQGGSSEWASAMQTARTLVERAVSYEPNLAHDEFVKLVLQNSPSATYAKRAPASSGHLDSMESSGAEDDDELLLGDLTAKRRLPLFGIGPTVFSGFQTQLFGVGVSGWLYLEKAFHLYFRYTYGLTLASKGTHFAEAYAAFPSPPHAVRPASS